MASKVKSLKMLIGQCVPCVKENASKIRIRKMELDENLFMVSNPSIPYSLPACLSTPTDHQNVSRFQYFNTYTHLFAHDPDKKCKVGDVVLVKELPEKLTRLITYSVEEIVFTYGDITDPLTGKKCIVSKYRDQIEEANKLFGESPNAFKYSEQPPRGRLEGIRDFTDKPTYLKWNKDGKPQPYSV